MDNFIDWINQEISQLQPSNIIEKQKILFLRQFMESYGFDTIFSHPIPIRSQKWLKLRYKLLKSKNNINQCVEWFNGLVKSVKREYEWIQIIEMLYN